jgi:hypothetical protein
MRSTFYAPSIAVLASALRATGEPERAIDSLRAGAESRFRTPRMATRLRKSLGGESYVELEEKLPVPILRRANLLREKQAVPTTKLPPDPFAKCGSFQGAPGVNTGPTGETWKLRRDAPDAPALPRTRSPSLTAPPPESSLVAMSMIDKVRSDSPSIPSGMTQTNMSPYRPT